MKFLSQSMRSFQRQSNTEIIRDGVSGGGGHCRQCFPSGKSKHWPLCRAAVRVPGVGAGAFRIDQPTTCSDSLAGKGRRQNARYFLLLCQELGNDADMEWKISEHRITKPFLFAQNGFHAPVSNLEFLKIRGFYCGDYEEYRLLRCGAVVVL
jgi:hypothetical protein